MSATKNKIDCTFATIRFRKKVCRDGKIKYQRDRTVVSGLLVDDKFYFRNGRYMYVNQKRFSVKKVYNYIPSWVTEELLAVYKKIMETKRLDNAGKH